MTKLEMNQMLEDNIKLVHYVFHQKFPALLGDEDLYQSGLIGLWKACRTFDETKSSFANYAIRCISNEILQQLKTRTTGIPAEMIISLETPIVLDDDGSNATLGDRIACVDNKLTYNETQEVIERVRNQLSANAQQVFDLMMEGYKQIDIGRILHMTRANVYNKVKQIRKLLQQELHITVE